MSDRDDRLFALKWVPKAAFSPRNEKNLESLRREFEVLSRLDHPNIARVLEWGTWGEAYGFLEEYIGGGDVFEALHGADYNRILSAFVQILRALHFLHGQGILHGDLKPENILVVKDASLLREDTVKLIDFGLAQDLQDLPDLPDLKGPRRPIGGSLHFLAPEILLEKPYDHRADLYALGVCLYRMTAGRYPFENDDARPDLIVRDQIGTVPVAPGRFRTDLPQGLNDLVMRLLEKRPEDRPPSAAQVLDALNELEGERFSLHLRRERLGGDSGMQRQEDEIRRLCAWADIPLTRETLLDLTDLPAERLDACLDALEGRGILRRCLRDGSYHFETVSQAEEEPSGEVPVASLLRLAESSYRSGRLREARTALKPLAKRSKAQGGNYYAIASLIELESGRLDEAEALCARFLELPRLTHEDQGKIHGRLGWIAYRRGRYAEALRHFDRSGPHWETSGNREGLASVANLKGMTYQALKEWEASLRSYQEALDRLSETDALFPVVKMNRAIAAQEAGRYETALADYEAAERAAEAGGNVQLRARLLHNLANLTLTLGRLDRASDSAHRSLKLAVENGLAGLEGNNYLLLSVIADREGLLDRCRDLVEKAINAFEKGGTSAEKAAGALHRAYYLFTAGEEDRVREVLVRLREDYLHETDLQRGVDLLEAKICARAEPPRLDPGLKLLNEAIRYYGSRGDLAPLWDALFTRGRLLRVADPAKAKASFEESREVLERWVSQIPESYRSGFFRDRKRERTSAQISALDEILNSRREGGNPMATQEGDAEIATVAKINRLLAAENNLTYLLETILEESLELLQAERGFVLLVEDDGFKIRAARHMDRPSLEDAPDAPGRYSATIARQAATGSRSILVKDAQADERFSAAKSVVELNIRAALAVPLKIGPEVVGVVYVDNRFSRGVFDEPHQRRLERFADQAALAVRNARQGEEIRARQREIEASKRQIEELNGLLKERLDLTEKELGVIQGKYQLSQDQLQLRYSYDQIVGKSPRLKDVLKVLDRVTDSDITVLIQGESGTGKELIARALHYNGPRKAAPFVAENCAAFSEPLLESELFGHINRQGLFEVADGGTIFLDEIGELSMSLQSKLLRVLQERQVRPLGGNEYRKINVRVIAATNKDLKAMVKEGKFREDLYYRVNVVKVVPPSLRDRKEDIPLLVDYFLKVHGKEAGATVKMHPKAMTHLLRYDWPGNVRELSNEIQKCIAMGAKMITTDALSEKITEEPEAAKSSSLDSQVSSVEKNVILETLKKHRYSRIKTAEALGVSRITLYKKMKAYGILARKPDYKNIST